MQLNPAPDGEIRARLDAGAYNLSHGTHLNDVWFDQKVSLETANAFTVPYYYNRQYTLYVMPPAHITGTVTDGSSGSPAADTEVQVTAGRPARWSHSCHRRRRSYSIYVEPIRAYAVYFNARPHNVLHTPALRSGFWSEWGLRTYWKLSRSTRSRTRPRTCRWHFHLPRRSPAGWWVSPVIRSGA